MTAAPRDTLPVLFLSHGSPMQAVQDDAVSQAWAAEARTLPRPRAVLMVSAHWESGVPLLTGSPQPETIHDFGGFPPELYRLRYPAPGAPDIAQRAQALLREADFCAGIDGTRGLDHGAWVPLLHMYPQADIPVLQLSVQPSLGAAHHVALGRAIAPLASEGVLIVASGHMTHNLRQYFHRDRSAVQQNRDFRDWVDAHIAAHDLDALTAWEAQAPYARGAHPTTEHFMPLFVALGAAGAHYDSQLLVQGYTGDVLAMDAYRFAQAA
ncbi:DODA-type extradiol aromatic ring-opening family dioxygenase [Uliginosibacterium sp. H1]|uniref:DODA-type extradiol aromatic ring-opening family dioxygenase n=1 Tax=Uliginosibacterium sp. H1 TaxID=3114757 RepID=UPI002E177570|nr:class III extradiol ring-cleavage dioxygenase [Uliginosibacterium sp. H1]